jgi:long-subunit fatty acid transport protein
VTSIPDQQEEIETRGATNQWTFAYGANYKDMLFFGGGIGLTSLRYKSQKIYSEEFDDPFLNDLVLDEELRIRGNGVNITLGTVIRPIKFVQIGLSYTSPTYYNLVETYSAAMNTSWKNFDYYGDGSTMLNEEFAETDIVTSDYNLTTPGKFSTGIAFISKYGFITGDIEFTNPGKAKYSSSTVGVSFGQENSDIRSVYKSVVNYRVGGEFRYEILRLRAGYGVQGSAYDDSFGLDNSIKTISAGAGIRLKRFFADFAITHSSSDSFYQPYTFFDGSGPVVSLNNSITTGMLTFGFTF